MISEPWVHYYIGDKLLDLIIEEFEGKEIYMTIEVID
ncbi:TPA_asm: hypothetical protein vir520_00013 [Caudoviricetes sp. vir520]|nr:TPA_asm: hypothetical protein vir520_00013 [Caudoviricetes sp. vir520]